MCSNRRVVESGTDLYAGEKKADGKDDEKEIKGECTRHTLPLCTHMSLSIGRQ